MEVNITACLLPFLCSAGPPDPRCVVLFCFVLVRAGSSQQVKTFGEGDPISAASRLRSLPTVPTSFPLTFGLWEQSSQRWLLTSIPLGRPLQALALGLLEMGPLCAIPSLP